MSDFTPQSSLVLRSTQAPEEGQLAEARRRSAKRSRWLGSAVSVGAHVLVLTVMFKTLAPAPKPPETPVMAVALVDGESLMPTPIASGAPPAEQPAPVEPKPPKSLVKPKPKLKPPPEIKRLPASEERAPATPQLTEAQLASAATADSGSGSGPGQGEGSGGGGCNMTRRLQSALQKDHLVQAAVADARRERVASDAIMVWNGDWVRNSAQDGKGLAAVRESLMWEIAFAPEACRTQPVHGLVLIALNNPQGSARLVVGSNDWRWTDLLHPAR